MSNANTKYDPAPTVGDCWYHAETGMRFAVKRISIGHEIQEGPVGEVVPTFLDFTYCKEGSDEWTPGVLVLLGSTDGDE